MPKVKRNAPGFGERLNRLRRHRGLTQTDLARAIGSSQKVVSDYERGIAVPSLPIIVELARELHVSADVLVGLRPVKSLRSMSLGVFRMRERIEKLKSLPRRQQQTIYELIDTYARESKQDGPTDSSGRGRRGRRA